MFSDPASNIALFDLKPNTIIADLGAGSGAYSLALAEKLREGGKVYAVEVQKDLLNRIAAEANKQHLTNIETVWANIEKPGGTKLADRSVDAVLSSNVLFQVEDRPGFIKEIYRILKPGGTLYLIDWADSFGGMGPQMSQVISKNKAEEMLTSASFTLNRDFNPGSHHYGLVFNKK